MELEALEGCDVGNYHIERLIGQGGMGAVFLARHAILGTPAAIKFLSPEASDNAEMVARFEREAKNAAALGHPNIVAVFDIGKKDGLMYMTMPYIDGRSLRDIIDDGPMPAAEAALLVEKILDAVGYAHARSVLHRDLKPDNIIITPEGHPRITDFGLARNMSSDARLTSAGQVIGTPVYMPVEQWDAAELDARTDIYALGVTFYEMLTGKPPFPPELQPGKLFRLIVAGGFPKLRTIAPEVPEPLEAVCMKMMALNPEDRYQSCDEAREDLLAALREIEDLLSDHERAEMRAADLSNRTKLRAISDPQVARKRTPSPVSSPPVKPHAPMVRPAAGKSGADIPGEGGASDVAAEAEDSPAKHLATTTATPPPAPATADQPAGDEASTPSMMLNRALRNFENQMATVGGIDAGLDAEFADNDTTRKRRAPSADDVLAGIAADQGIAGFGLDDEGPGVPKDLGTLFEIGPTTPTTPTTPPAKHSPEPAAEAISAFQQPDDAKTLFAIGAPLSDSLPTSPPPATDEAKTLLDFDAPSAPADSPAPAESVAPRAAADLDDFGDFDAVAPPPAPVSVPPSPGRKPGQSSGSTSSFDLAGLDELDDADDSSALMIKSDSELKAFKLPEDVAAPRSDSSASVSFEQLEDIDDDDIGTEVIKKSTRPSASDLPPLPVSDEPSDAPTRKGSGRRRKASGSDTAKKSRTSIMPARGGEAPADASVPPPPVIVAAKIPPPPVIVPVPGAGPPLPGVASSDEPADDVPVADDALPKMPGESAESDDAVELTESMLIEPPRAASSDASVELALADIRGMLPAPPPLAIPPLGKPSPPPPAAVTKPPVVPVVDPFGDLDSDDEGDAPAPQPELALDGPGEDFQPLVTVNLDDSALKDLLSAAARSDDDFGSVPESGDMAAMVADAESAVNAGSSASPAPVASPTPSAAPTRAKSELVDVLRPPAAEQAPAKKGCLGVILILAMPVLAVCWLLG